MVRKFLPYVSIRWCCNVHTARSLVSVFSALHVSTPLIPVLGNIIWNYLPAALQFASHLKCVPSSVRRTTIHTDRRINDEMVD